MVIVYSNFVTLQQQNPKMHTANNAVSHAKKFRASYIQLHSHKLLAYVPY